MLGDEMVPELELIGEQPKLFMQDGAPPHYATAVRHWLDDMFPHRWIERRGPVEWAPRSPDLNTLDFAFWGFLMAQVYTVKIRDIRHRRQRITDCCVTVNPSMLSKIRINMVKRVRKCVECRGEHIEHIM
jgi:hypothetical protein